MHVCMRACLPAPYYVAPAFPFPVPFLSLPIHVITIMPPRSILYPSESSHQTLFENMNKKRLRKYQSANPAARKSFIIF